MGGPSKDAGRDLPSAYFELMDEGPKKTFSFKKSDQFILGFQQLRLYLGVKNQSKLLSILFFSFMSDKPEIWQKMQKHEITLNVVKVSKSKASYLLRRDLQQLQEHMQDPLKWSKAISYAEGLCNDYLRGRASKNDKEALDEFMDGDFTEWKQKIDEINKKQNELVEAQMQKLTPIQRSNMVHRANQQHVPLWQVMNLPPKVPENQKPKVR